MPPATRKQPRDHLKPAQQREAESDDTTATVEWRGRTFTFPANPGLVSGATILAFEQDKIMSALIGMIGPAQWALVEDETLVDLGELFDLIAQALGFAGGVGESTASSA